MLTRTVPCLVVALFLFSGATVMCAAQAKFSTIPSVHFEIRYIQGVTENEARQILGFLQTDYDTLRNQLGLDVREKLEVRLYDSPGRFRSEINAGKDVLSSMYVHGILHVLTTAPAQVLEKAMRYQLARVFLEQTMQRSCPLWLNEAFAVHHSGVMVDLSPPGSVAVASFSDLTQDLEDAGSPTERNDVNFVLGRTMQFFIDRYGRAKAFGIFKEFDGVLPVEKVFKRVFVEEFQDIEKTWSKYVAVKPRKGK